MDLIPKKIYQTWKTKNVTPDMQENIGKIKKLNPEYTYTLYDDNDCRAFILAHFGIEYANAFDSIKIGAFKADFWRYCKLYIDGGVYIDMDMTPEVPFNEIISPKDKFVSVVDRTAYNRPGIYQAFIAAVPKHPILLASLQICFVNIITKRPGIPDVLCVTGPCVMAVALNIFLGRKNTMEKIKPGSYPDGIKLFRVNSNNTSTYDLENRKIFTNKFEGYAEGSYGFQKNYYKNDPSVGFKKIILYIIIAVIVLIIVGYITAIIFRYKWKKCEKTCSMGSGYEIN